MGYFDHCASTPLSKTVLKEWSIAYESFYANPSSPHRAGNHCQELLTQARMNIANCIGCSAGYIYFTSGATESANLLIQGRASFLEQTNLNKNEIIISSIEHAAVKSPTYALRKKEWKVHEIGVDTNGLIKMKDLLDSINEKTAIISIIAVNNEIGVIQNIEEISQKVKEKNRDVFFITDVAQALGKVMQTCNLKNVDALFLSGQKIGAPKGTGFFYLNPVYRIYPLFFGGGQESGYRPGTNDPVGAKMLSIAFEERCANLKNNYNYVSHLRDNLIQKLTEYQVPFYPTIDLNLVSPYILSLVFPNVRSNRLIENLSERGIYISGKTACSSACSLESPILTALNNHSEYINNVVRISFGIENTLEEVNTLAETIATMHKVILESAYLKNRS